MKEIEKERMMRLEAEQRLRETRQESDACRARLKSLQEEFTKMEDTVQSMLQYKTKIEQLKQEKLNLASTYESSIQKHRNHISKLERENILLLNQVKKLESQSLREECIKLQGRVHDQELQNQQLRTMFKNRIRYSSDSHLQKSSPQSSDSSKNNSLLGSSISFDESFGQPQMSSPPPWLRDKLEEKLRNGVYNSDGDLHTKIETEFPATNSSPKIKHINVHDRSYGSWGRTPPKPQRKGKTSNKSPRNSQSMSPRNSRNMSQGATGGHVPHEKSSDKNVPSPMPKQTGSQIPVSSIPASSHLNPIRSNSNSPKPKQSFRSQYFYDYSDEDSDCRPMTLKEVSSSSTVSLNELLDSSLEDAELPTDEDFYSDWSPKSMSPKPLPTDLSAMKTMQNFMFPPPPLKNGSINLGAEKVSQKNSITSDTLQTTTSLVVTTSSRTTITSNSSDLVSNQSQNVQNSVSQSITNSGPQGSEQVLSAYGYTNGASPKVNRPENLILAPREKNFMLNSLSSTSSEGKTISTSSLHSLSDKSPISQPTSPVKKSSPKDSRCIPKPKHYVEIQVKKPTEPKKRSVVESPNKSKVATIVPTPRSPKKSPPPVPKKPVRTNVTSSKPKTANVKSVDPKKQTEAKSAASKSPGKKIQGIVNPIVNSVVNSVFVEPNNFPVLDIGFGPKWPTPETNLESIRVERSGSRDDGYSTMSSDIQPEAMEKFSDATSVKKSEAKNVEGCQDLNSDLDSAMENSTHSAELQNSTHSLSSQVSTSSGEILLSPGNKVRDMRKVFEQDTQTIKSAKKSAIPVIKSSLGPKLQFFQTESKSLENLATEKEAELPDLAVKTSWNYHSFNEVKTSSTNRSYGYNENQTITLPLGEDQVLEDIPEDRELETKQPSTFISRFPPDSPPTPPPHRPKSSRTKSSPRIARALSDSDIHAKHKSRPATLFDDFTDGQWSDERIFERSTSITEMDMIDSTNRYIKPSVCLLLKENLEIDEAAIAEKVKNFFKLFLMSKMSMTSSTTSSTTDSDSDGDLEAALKINKEWAKKTSNYRLPIWQPRETLEALKKSSTPSPVSIKSFDSSPAEDWLLKFSKEEIESHLTTTSATFNSSSLNNSQENQNPYMAYSDLSHFASSSDTSTVIDTHSSPEKETNVSGVKVLNLSPSSGSERNSLVSEEGNSEDGSQSPSLDQKKFHSEFYSLCLVESNRSLVSSSSQGSDIHKLVAKDSFKDSVAPSVKDREFDEITRQIQSLSKTVNDLHQSLTSLNSADSESRDSLMDCHLAKSIDDSKRNSMDGYHWEEDDYYLTSCGGEVIIGSDSLLDQNNCAEWIKGLEVERDANESAEINEEYYEIQVNGENCTRVSGYVYNGNYSDEVGVHDDSFEQNDAVRAKSSSTNQLADPEHRANLLDSMFVSGTESNDSLATDIGLDSMMCQRLVGGRKARHEAMKSNALPRQPLDFSKFFIRFDQPEKEAVAAFNFLEDISTSTSESGSEQRLYNPETDRQLQSAEVYIVDNYPSRSRRGDKIRRRRKIEKSRPQPRSASSTPGKSAVNHEVLCVSKKLNESLNTSSDAPEICAGNLSLSDSCCESFSSSDQSVNDLTML
ncbi:hypothetical protein LOTGIDRAFT_172421 [Lottia gigantea]|uniref:Nck-associated protein 5 C-terminal domain-containing protein n=1 Tax=Lottia gigantea TaxID=225164 RepID=V4ACN1_LOTGI|nr:hypothetical protein LOTGIDRAFT_172421 [Lottia gigantea]ESP01774.1 hypothetical protein LOTGIDRAFT_172421 [Lottia gigantea]